MTEGNAIFLVGIMFMSIGLMVVGFVLRRTALAWSGSGFWLASAGASYIQSSVTWDVYFLVMWLSFGMAIVSFMLGMVVREQSDTPDSDARWGDDEHFEEQHRMQIARQQSLRKYDELTSGKFTESVWDKPKREAGSDRKN